MSSKTKKKQVTEVVEEIPDDGFDTGWLIACALVTAVATGLRFVMLGLKPFHHDEGVNGWFLTTLFREGVYKYDPANYHGPTLYYISLAFANVFGLETIPLRWSVAIWGVLTVVLAFWLRRYIGRNGSLFAALFLGLSPGMVYISRYFIHEIFFVFLALAVVIAIIQFIERERAGWFAIGWTALILLVCFFPSTLQLSSLLANDGTTSLTIIRVVFFLIEAALVALVLRMLMTWRDGRPIYFLLAAASVALIFATKETGFITLGTMAIAIGCVFLWEKIASLKPLVESPVNRFIAIIVLPALAGLYFHETVRDGLTAFYDGYVKNAPHDAGVRYLIVTLVMCSIAALAAFVYREWVKPDELTRFTDPSWSKFHKGMGSGIDLVLILLGSAIVFVYLWILFFSSFFTYSDGLGRSIEAYAIWTKTGSKDHTQNGPFGYLRWGMAIEAPLIVLSTLGLVIALVRARHRFALFAALWAFGLFLAYSIIPYKTPWLMLSFLLPMCIVAGYALNELAGSKFVINRIFAAVLAVLASVILTWQTYDHNFVRFDDDRMPYVYAHTSREFLDMVDEIERAAELSGKGNKARIQIVSPDYWPLVWYLRNYEHAGFHGRMVDADNAEAIVFKKNGQEPEAMQRYSSAYEYVASYKLRPGVELGLYIRKDLVRFRVP